MEWKGFSSGLWELIYDLFDGQKMERGSIHLKF